ncbi:MAG TPA: hypothetical protein VKU82_01170 [Planctomycetaceae bacterium]|nr:hypothetical protein [Planctomycetaceae bacterium]
MPKTAGARLSSLQHENAGIVPEAAGPSGPMLRIDAPHAADSAHDKVRLLAAILQPQVPSSFEEMIGRRKTFSERLAALLAAGVQLDPESDEMPATFGLAEYDLDSRDVRRDLARLYPVLPARPLSGFLMLLRRSCLECRTIGRALRPQGFALGSSRVTSARIRSDG